MIDYLLIAVDFWSRRLRSLNVGLCLPAFSMRRLQLLGEGAPDAFFAGAVLLCEGLHERADADALVEVGVVGVCAGSDIVDDLVAGVEFAVACVVETAHEVEGLGLVRRTSTNGGHQLLKGPERERTDLHFAVVLDEFELLADIIEGRGQHDADECQVCRGEFSDDAHGRIALNEQLEKGFLTADDTIEKVVVVPESFANLLIGLHHM